MGALACVLLALGLMGLGLVRQELLRVFGEEPLERGPTPAGKDWRASR